MRKLATIVGGSFAALCLVAAPAAAAVTFDPVTGEGFAGKGDVQLAFGWSNAQLQNNANGVAFSIESVTEAETTWTCFRTNPQGTEQTQERNRTTTTETQALFESVTRVRNQITGFTLKGFEGTPVTEFETDGPAEGSCPSGWTARDIVTGAPETVSGGVYATHNAITQLISAA